MTAAKLIYDNSPAGSLSQLKAQRSALAERIAELTAARQRLGEAEEAERAATAAIGELDAVEIAATSEWASSGCSGPIPTPDLSKRAGLAKQLAAAQAASTAAKGAGSDIDGQLAA